MADKCDILNFGTRNAVQLRKGVSALLALFFASWNLEEREERYTCLAISN